MAGIVAIAVEGALAVVWAAALSRRAQALSERLLAERAAIQDDIKRLVAALEETQRLWQPFRRVLRWLRHPLTIALLQSLARRRAAAR